MSILTVTVPGYTQRQQLSLVLYMEATACRGVIHGGNSLPRCYTRRQQLALVCSGCYIHCTLRKAVDLGHSSVQLGPTYLNGRSLHDESILIDRGA